MTHPRLLPACLAAILALTLGACGGSDPPDKLGAAEPATAPATGATPAGTTAKVGAQPQGIVYDKRTDLLAVAVRKPYRLELLDPRTLTLTRTVPLPGKVRHLQLGPGGGSVLAPTESANQIVQVTLPGGRTRTTEVQRHPHDAAAAANGDVIVGNEFSGSISVVRDGVVIKTFDDLRQPGGVVTDGATVAVVDVGDFTVSTYDLATMRRTGRVAAGSGPTHGVIVGPDKLAVSDTRGGRLLLYGLDPLRRTGSLKLPGSPYGLAGDPTTGTVWVSLTAENEVVGVDVSGASPRIVARYPTVRQPDTVAVAPGSRTIWVAGTVDGVVQRITR